MWFIHIRWKVLRKRIPALPLVPTFFAIGPTKPGKGGEGGESPPFRVFRLWFARLGKLSPSTCAPPRLEAPQPQDYAGVLQIDHYTPLGRLVEVIRSVVRSGRLGDLGSPNRVLQRYDFSHESLNQLRFKTRCTCIKQNKGYDYSNQGIDN